MKTFHQTVVALGCGLLLSGLSSAQETQTVRIGHAAPMSGGQTHYGKDNANGATMAIEDLNAARTS